MDKKSYVQFGSSLIGIGGFMAGVPTALAIQSSFIVVVSIVGVSIGGVGIMLTVFPFIPRFDEPDLEVRRVKRNDLKGAYLYCGGIFGDNFSSYNQMKAWFHHNEKVFWILEEIKKKGAISLTKIIGFYSVLPLNKNGFEMVMNNQLDGRGFTVEHITKDFRSATALYVGVIASDGRKARHQSIASLLTTVQQLREAKDIPILTRPTTTEGLHLAKRRGFEAIDGSGTQDLDKVYRHRDV
ncbi:hypothetical protein [Alteromonas sp. KUL49]|uniref:hypothetical protein n=1 Tax=Alteromonas sp. KUL49 TaxID=2480798 RepID=UPI00102EDD82|nr:hypothetical protein [Alteromonas sp. KUL49]TAP40940.1 hypothetical protein EYS00_07490 [Alteromonas sp. KUL49]GEA11122.1 hypothetical protein KUL49_14970 [Alteromonas sp. KUL49]